MFKKRDGEIGGGEPEFGTRVNSPIPSSPMSEDQEEETSVVGHSLEVEGKLITDTNLRINGRVKGDVVAKAVTVGQHASVEGIVISNEVVVSGTVIGEIRAVHVRLCNTAVVSGEIMHKLFAIESGAQFEGSVRHSAEPLDESAPLPWHARDEVDAHEEAHADVPEHEHVHEGEAAEEPVW